jgi:putative multiple sugar transport system substrate-binding protein
VKSKLFLLSLTTLMLFALLLSACGGATPTEEPAPPPEEEPVQEATEPAEEVAEPLEFGEPTLTTEGLGTADDLVPGDAEIETALARLDANESFVGIVACTYSTDYHSTVPDSAKEYAEELGIGVQTFDSEIDVEKQISGIENFVSSGADVIVVCVFDPPSVESALQEAADAGVYIVQYAGRDAAAFGGVTIRSMRHSSSMKRRAEWRMWRFSTTPTWRMWSFEPMRFAPRSKNWHQMP